MKFAQRVHRRDWLTIRARADAVDPETGFLRADVFLTRTGVFEYRMADGTILRELRHPDDVFDPAHLESMKRAVATRGHPRNDDGEPVWVNTGNVANLQVGHLGDSFERSDGPDGERVKGGITITNKDVVASVVGNRRDMVSLGYDAILVDESGVWDGPNGPEPYDVRQIQMRVNHVAVDIDRGRAGPSASITIDEDDALAPSPIRRDPGRPRPPGVTLPTPHAHIDKDDPMTTPKVLIHLDSTQVEIDSSAAPFVTTAIRLRDDKIGTLEQQAKKLADDLKTSQDELAAAKKELDEANEKIKAADEAGAGGNAAETVLAIAQAGKLVQLSTVVDEAKGTTVLEAFSKMTPAQIRRAVVTKVRQGDESLKDKTDDYVAAVFDEAVRNATEGKRNVDGTAGLAGLLVGLDEGQGFSAPAGGGGGSGRPAAPTNLDDALDLVHFGAAS